MAETQLITITEARTYVDISPNYAVTRFNIYVTNVQRDNLRKLMGKQMYYDFWQNYPDGGVYDDLVGGKVYELNGENVQYYGLKPYLSYLVMATIALEGDYYHADYGNAVFTDNPQDNLVKAMDRRRIEMYDRYMQKAREYEEDVLNFLAQNSTDYPLLKKEFQKPDIRNQIITATLR